MGFFQGFQAETPLRDTWTELATGGLHGWAVPSVRIGDSAAPVDRCEGKGQSGLVAAAGKEINLRGGGGDYDWKAHTASSAHGC